MCYDCFGYIKVYCQSHKLGVAEPFHPAGASCLCGGLTDFKGTLLGKRVCQYFGLEKKQKNIFSFFCLYVIFFLLLDELKWKFYMIFCVPQNVWSLCEAWSKRISIAATILFPSLVVEILKMLLKIFIDFSPHYK